MAERINAVKTSFFGKGAIRLLGPELQKMGIRRALLVTDRFLYDSGAAARVGQVLSDAGVEYAVYYNVQPNPTVQVVNDCIAAARTLQVQLLVALGGGSAIDTAKAASIVVACGGTVEQYEGENKSSKPGLPIVAVNTTAGTGSECTSFYIVTDPVRHSKMAMVDPNCMVSIAVNDTDFMSSMPPKLTAATGMDALTHAIEAALSKNANPLTDKDAYWAMQAIVQNLPRAVANGQDEAARTMMAYAENVAGMAFSTRALAWCMRWHTRWADTTTCPTVCAMRCCCLRAGLQQPQPGVPGAVHDHCRCHGPAGHFYPGHCRTGSDPVCPSAQCRRGHPRKPCAAEQGEPCRFCRAGRACAARHLHVHQPDHPHPRRGGGGIYRCFPRINFETSSIFSIPKQSRRSPSARECGGFVL